MIAATQLLTKSHSRRDVIAPALSRHIRKLNGILAAVVLEFVSSEVAPPDIERCKSVALDSLFRDLANLLDVADFFDDADGELQLSI
jgi:hypothetical protein